MAGSGVEYRVTIRFLGGSEMNGKLVVALVGVCVLLPEASGKILSTTPNVVEIEAPPSVLGHALEADTLVRAFNERYGVVLPVGLDVNISTPGRYDSTTSLTPRTIPAGSLVQSHFLHFDPEGSTRSDTHGSVTFDMDILGLIVTNEELDLADHLLGLAGTIYPTGEYGRAAEVWSEEIITLEADQRTLQLDYIRAGGFYYDQLRVISACTPLLPGDANRDGSVDDDDLSLLLANWGQDTDWGHGEFNEVAPVNDDDLSLLLANWTGSPDSIGIPEPTTVGLLAVGAMVMLRRRRRL